MHRSPSSQTALLYIRRMGVLLSSECGVQQWVKEQGFSTFGEPRTFCSFAEAVEEGSNMLATRSLSEYVPSFLLIVCWG